MTEPYDVPKETAEKVLKNVMELLKDKKEAGDPEATTMYDRLGIIAMALAGLYSNEQAYSDAIETVSRENVRLHDTITVLTQRLSDADKALDVITEHAEKLQDDIDVLKSEHAKTL